MPQFNLIDVSLKKENNELKFQEISWNDPKTNIIYKQNVPIPSDISCDFSVNINVHGYYNVEILDRLFNAMQKAIDELNQD